MSGQPPRGTDSTDGDNGGEQVAGSPQHESSEETGESPQQASEILENLPPSQKEPIDQFFAAAMTSMGNPFAQKIESQHITDMIALQSKEVDLEYDDRKHSRRYVSWFFGAVIAMVIIFAALLALNGQNDLLIELMKVGGALAGGFGGGYGYAHWRGRR